VTSDHGDMQMEKQQHYKMVPYDASASVPMVIFDGRPGHRLPSPRVIDTPTQLIDIFPTILELAAVPQHATPVHDGFSLLPLMHRPAPPMLAPVDVPVDAAGGMPVDTSRPPFIVSQFHGDDIAMSWFLVVKRLNASAVYKLIVWGTGGEVPHLLFELTTDPNEEHDLLATSAGARRHKPLVEELLADLRTVVDYPTVARAVAQYGVDSLRAWTQRTPDWRNQIHDGLRWDAPWTAHPNGSLAAVEALLAKPDPATIMPCRRSLKWPPSSE